VIPASAIELLQLNPNVIVVQGARAVPILQQATKTIPIVFISISDPVGRGIVTNMARPGGNITEVPIVRIFGDYAGSGYHFSGQKRHIIALARLRRAFGEQAKTIA
jgi:hypothetical protein